MPSTLTHAPQPASAESMRSAASASQESTSRGDAGSASQWQESPRQLQQGARLAQLRSASAAEHTARGGLPEGLQRGIETLSGMDMSGVRVHRNSAKPAALQAHAYAQGQDIHLGPGQEKHLPHEAWHVVQQAQGRVRATKQMKAGIPVNDDAGLEREADAMGAKALSLAGTQGAYQLRAAPPAMPAVALVQRVINVNSVPYSSKADFGTLCGLIGTARMKQLGGTSKKLLEWVTDPAPRGDFTDADELFEALNGLRQRGIKAQQVGEERESQAGGSAGDLSKDRQRGSQIYENNGVKLLAGFHGQDPFLKHPDGSALQLDTVSDTVWGLVGGPAKAKSGSSVDQELTRLRTLQKCCKLDGRHEGEVRYHDIKNTDDPLFARLVKCALERDITTYVNGVLQRKGGPGTAQGGGTAKNVGRTLGTAAGIYGGVKLGAAFGTTLGPVGTLVGGVVGGIGGYLLGGKIGEQVGRLL